MKILFSILTALLTAEFSCLGQGTIVFKHTGYKCPGGAHPWASGDRTNIANVVDSALFKNIPATGWVLQATNQVNRSNWTSEVTVLSESGPFLPDTTYQFSVLPTYPDECAMHTNYYWASSLMLVTGTFTNGTSFSETNTFVMAGVDANPFGSEWPLLGSVANNSSYMAYINQLLYTNYSGSGGWLPLGGPRSFEEGIKWRLKYTGPVPPGPLSNFGLGGQGGGVELSANNGDRFGVQSSTNLVDWVWEADIVCDEYGWANPTMTTNLFADPLKVWKIIYTNSP